MDSENKISLQVKIDSKLMQKLHRLAKRRGMFFSKFITEVLQKAVKGKESGETNEKEM